MHNNVFKTRGKTGNQFQIAARYALRAGMHVAPAVCHLPDADFDSPVLKPLLPIYRQLPGNCSLELKRDALKHILVQACCDPRLTHT